MSFVLLLAFVYFLNHKTGSIPPLGKLLNPYNGFWQNAEAYAQIPLPEKIQIEGLIDEVTIKYDSALIPHIFAKNEHDLFIAQGYITARHRLWQMETQMRFAAGRIAEVLGADLTNIDQQNRRSGLAYGAEQSLVAVEKIPELYAALQAYTQGVNTYISSLGPKDYPLEYKILDYEPELWTEFKNVLLLKYMAQVLAGGDSDLQNTNLVHLFGKEVYDLLFPDQPEGIDPVIPSKKWDFDPLKVKIPDSLHYPSLGLKSVSDPGVPGVGSNNWAVSGSKTASGHAILSNDPHLNITIPSLWILMHLEAPGYSTMGVTIPGMAGILLGFNDSISWGLTNSPRDLRDWYQITFKDESKNEYLYDGKWLKTQKRIEEIKVRGQATLYDTVIYTHYGPVVYEENFDKNEGLKNAALRWSAHDPSVEAYVIYLLNKAKNYDEFVAGIQHMECPPQNIVMASTSGDISMWVSGKFPLKWPGQGKFLMDGSNSAYEWQDYIPWSHNAHVLNPERNFVSSANQHPFDSRSYPYYFYNNSNEYYRNRIINRMLDTMNQITVADMEAMLVNNYSLHFQEAKTWFIDSLDFGLLGEAEGNYLKKISQWNGYYEPELEAPVYWEIYWRKFKNLLWSGLRNDSLPTLFPNDYVTLQLLKKDPELSFLSLIEANREEKIGELLSRALIEASAEVKELEKNREEAMTWAGYKSSILKHNLHSAIPYFSIPLKNGGNNRSINAMTATHGPSWRMVAEMSTPIAVKGIYPGGQSGNPGSPWYQTFVKDWEEGRLIHLEFPKKADILLQKEFFTISLTNSK